MLKILPARLNSMWNENFQMYNLGFREVEEPEIKLPTFNGSWRKQGSAKKTTYFCFMGYAKTFDFVDHNTLENYQRDGNTLPVSWEICM